MYNCNKCKKDFEDLQLYDEPVIGQCPSCGKKSKKRILGVPNLSIDGEPKTLGMLAEQNNKHIGNSNVKKKIDSFKTEKQPR